MTANFTWVQDMNNYGQRLQNYALQEFLLDELGETMITMDGCDPSRKDVDLDDDKYFHRFERECMHMVDIRKSGPGILLDFDHILVGGDQVLNTDYHEVWHILPYISGSPARRRNVFSYSAGISCRRAIRRDLLDSLEPRMIVYGLRESPAYHNFDYVKNIDPVFLLMDKWDKMAQGSYPEGGVVKYIVKDGRMSELSRTGAALQGPVPDPRVFVGLFKGADKVVTNSFHGICFAVMNRVPEIEILNPGDHRIANLKDILGMRTEGGKVLNYDEIFAKIRSEAAKAREYLSICLNSRPVDYCAYSRDRLTRNSSASGGVAAELARAVLDKGGSVFGGAFSEDFRKVVPYCARTMDEYFAKLSKSKYSFCALPKPEDLKKELEKGGPVMYIGSPCHVRALRKLLGEIPPSLFLVDFRCRGYSHPDKLRKTVDYIERRYGGKVVKLDFRPNHKSEILARLDNGREVRYSSGIWSKFIYDALPMCGTCPLAHGMLSEADVTVADFWYNSNDRMRYGWDFTPQHGCNIVSVNTARGQGLWDGIRGRLEYRPVAR